MSVTGPNIDVDLYQADGYLPLGRLLGDADVSLVSGQFDDLDTSGNVPSGYEAEYDGDGPGRRLRKLRRLVWNEPELFGPILNRAGVPDIAEAVIGPHATAVFHAAFLKPARIGTHVAPHQDQALWSRVYPGAFSIWFALTEVTPGNGGLYGYPSSHAQGVIPHKEDSDHPWHESLSYASDSLGEAHQFDLSPGEAVMWDRCFVHGSGGNSSSSDRRGMVIVLADGSGEEFSATDAMPITQLRKWG